MRHVFSGFQGFLFFVLFILISANLRAEGGHTQNPGVEDTRRPVVNDPPKSGTSTSLEAIEGSSLTGDTPEKQALLAELQKSVDDLDRFNRRMEKSVYERLSVATKGTVEIE